MDTVFYRECAELENSLCKIAGLLGQQPHDGKRDFRIPREKVAKGAPRKRTHEYVGQRKDIGGPFSTVDSGIFAKYLTRADIPERNFLAVKGIGYCAHGSLDQKIDIIGTIQVTDYLFVLFDVMPTAQGGDGLFRVAIEGAENPYFAQCVCVREIRHFNHRSLKTLCTK
jgi:hypothetical protein